MQGHIKNEDMTYVEKRWGHELWITNTERYCGKILHINNGSQCSFHYHKIKDEVLFIHSGTCHFRVYDPEVHVVGEEVHLTLKAGDAFYVRPGVIHQMTAVDGDVEIFEISTQHFDSDSYRVEV